MRERPMLFSSEMVRAILEGRKTQTRRLVTAGWDPNGYPSVRVLRSVAERTGVHAFFSGPQLPDELGVRCPFGVPRDRLWVRETLRNGANDKWQYAADDKVIVLPREDNQRVLAMRVWVHHVGRDYCPSIHMPRWASRLTLEITGVRVERLQDISEADAQAEGVARDTEPCDHKRQSCEDIGCMGPTHRSTYCELWDALNAKRAPWSSNPWVWVLSFCRVEKLGASS